MTDTPRWDVADLSVDGRAYPLYERIYLGLAGIFVVVLVLTNMVGVKLFQAPFNREFALTTGIIVYPITFLVTDIVSEIYGKRRADFMVALGFGMSILMVLVVQISLAVEPHAYWVPPTKAYYSNVGEYQKAFESVFTLQGVLLFGSMCAYLLSQLCDNWLYHFWKRFTNGRHLWLRNNGSTMVSQLVDTIVVNSILFYVGFGMDFMVGVEIMTTIYLYKVVIAALDTPFMYAATYLIKRALGARFDEEVRDPGSAGVAS